MVVVLVVVSPACDVVFLFGIKCCQRLLRHLAIPTLFFFFIFIFSIKQFRKFADDWIQTVDLWYQKHLLYINCATSTAHVVNIFCVVIDGNSLGLIPSEGRYILFSNGERGRI